jgi:hypothetical protein
MVHSSPSETSKNDPDAKADPNNRGIYLIGCDINTSINCHY